MIESFKEFYNLIFSDAGIGSAIQVTFVMGICSTLISTVLGTILGLLLEQKEFIGKKIVIRVNRTLMGVPPVVVGLFVYMLIMRRGPLGRFELLFTIQGMVLAQVLIITPIICGMTYTAARKTAPAVRFFATSIGATKRQTQILIIKELKRDLYFAMITGFGRAISEVGAVMLVGGNMKERTRTMTTTISLLKSQGIFTQGLYLGILLLTIAFVLQWAADKVMKEEQQDDNY